MSERYPPAGTCPECGKLCYTSRREARRDAGKHGTRRRAYRCGNLWHLATYQPAAKVAWYRERAQ